MMKMIRCGSVSIVQAGKGACPALPVYRLVQARKIRNGAKSGQPKAAIRM